MLLLRNKGLIDWLILDRFHRTQCQTVQSSAYTHIYVWKQIYWKSENLTEGYWVPDYRTASFLRPLLRLSDCGLPTLPYLTVWGRHFTAYSAEASGGPNTRTRINPWVTETSSNFLQTSTECPNAPIVVHSEQINIFLNAFFVCQWWHYTSAF